MCELLEGPDWRCPVLSLVICALPASALGSGGPFPLPPLVLLSNPFFWIVAYLVVCSYRIYSQLDCFD